MRRFVIVLVLVSMLFSPWTSVTGVRTEEEHVNEPMLLDVPEVTIEVSDNVLEMRRHLSFGDMFMEDVEGYSMLYLDGATGYHMEAGAPILPTYGEMFSFPVGTMVRSVTIGNGVHHKVVMEDKVVPAPEPIPLTFGSVPMPLSEGGVYGQDVYFPAEELSFRVTTGSSRWNGIEAHLFVTVFPLRYNPVASELDLMEEADIVIVYDLPDRDLLPATRETYQILAIAPEDLVNETLRYKTHKEDLGWTVKVVSLDNVYDNSIFNTSLGRDNPERIKIFVYNAVLNWSVEHFLIVGDSDKFPVRYCRIEDGADGTSTPSDFYFGDVLKQGTTNFSDWNSDNDGYWCESRNSNKNADGADLDPDVTVGRYPASTVTELENLIDKTISYYENVSTPEGKEWFRNVSFNGADTFGGSSGGVMEGEFALNTAALHMTEFNITKFYQSTGTFVKANIESFLNKGAGFASWSDHGSTGGVVWTSGGYGPGLSSTVADRLTNQHRLFLSIQDACSTNRFDGMDGLGEHIVLNPNGAGIGAIGMTRIGWGMWDQWHIMGLSGYMGVHLIEKYSDGNIMPGVMLDETRRSYLSDWGMNWVSDMKTLAGYALFGDPTTFLGGPEISFEAYETEVWAAPGDEVTFDVTIRSSEFHDDELNISMSGGAWDWDHNLTKSKFQMVSNDTVNMTISVTVDDHALAYSSDSVTLSVETLSVPFPIEQVFKVNVIEVRSVDIQANETEYTVLPGENVTVDYSIINNGNIFENATAWFHGDHGDWVVNITQVNITVDAFDTYFDNVTITVPEETIAGNYHFELLVETENGSLRSFFIKVTVDKTYGLDAYALIDVATLELSNVAFPIIIENLGNYQEDVEHVIDLVSRPTGPSTDWAVEYLSPDTIVIPPFENTSEMFGIGFSGEVLAGTYDFLLSVNLISDDTHSKDIMLKVIINELSIIDLEATQVEISADQGGSAEFSLNIDSLSNFEENVTVDVLDLPEGWAWGSSMAEIIVPAFSETPFELTFEVPDEALAGEYDVEVVAYGKDSNKSVTLTIVVQAERSIDLSIDKDEAKVFIGEGTDFELTISNPGNIDDKYILRTIEARGLIIWFEEELIELGPWSDDTAVKMSVDVRQGTAEGRYEFEVAAISIFDDSVVSSVKATMIAKERFVPAPDLKILGGGASVMNPGDLGSFVILLLNNGNVDELVNLTLKDGSTWTISHPANATLEPEAEKEVTVTFEVPKDAKKGVFNIEIFVGSDSTDKTVLYVVTVEELPEKGTTPLGGESDMLPLFLMIIIIVLIILLVAALMRKPKEDLPPPTGTPVVYEPIETEKPPGPEEPKEEGGDGSEGPVKEEAEDKPEEVKKEDEAPKELEKEDTKDPPKEEKVEDQAPKEPEKKEEAEAKEDPLKDILGD